MNRCSQYLAGLAVAILIPIGLFSQSFIVLKDGKTVPFDKKEWRDKYKMSENVLGIYEGESALMSYHIPVTDTAWGNPYAMMVREIEGPISVFSETVRLQNSVQVRMYALKDGKYSQIYTNEVLSGAKRMVDVLRQLVADDPKASAMMDSTFRRTERNIFRVVNEYNNNKYTIAPGDFEQLAPVHFYTSVPAKQPVTMKVNDSLVYKVPRTYPLLLKLPTRTPVKICFSRDDGGEECRLFAGIPYGTFYYEVDYKSDELQIKNKSLQEAQKVFSYLRKNGLP